MGQYGHVDHASLLAHQLIDSKRLADLLSVKVVKAVTVAMEVKLETVDIAEVIEAVDQEFLIVETVVIDEPVLGKLELVRD